MVTQPGTPAYPVVVCFVCGTRWIGYREDRDSKPLDPRLPDALRDAVILDQADRVFEIIEKDLGYVRKQPASRSVDADGGYSRDHVQIVMTTPQSPRVVAEQVLSFLTSNFVGRNFVDGGLELPSDRCERLVLTYSPGNGFRDEIVREWRWPELDVMSSQTIVTYIMDAADLHVEAAPVDQWRRFIIRIYRFVSRGTAFAFQLASPDRSTTETTLLRGD